MGGIALHEAGVLDTEAGDLGGDLLAQGWHPAHQALQSHQYWDCMKKTVTKEDSDCTTAGHIIQAHAKQSLIMPYVYQHNSWTKGRGPAES